MKDIFPITLHILPGRLIDGIVIPPGTRWQASRPHIVIFLFLLVQCVLICIGLLLSRLLGALTLPRLMALLL